MSKFEHGQAIRIVNDTNRVGVEYDTKPAFFITSERIAAEREDTSNESPLMRRHTPLRSPERHPFPPV
jgi:hypothetical protein